MLTFGLHIQYTCECLSPMHVSVCACIVFIKIDVPQRSFCSLIISYTHMIRFDSSYLPPIPSKIPSLQPDPFPGWWILVWLCDSFNQVHLSMWPMDFTTLRAQCRQTEILWRSRCEYMSSKAVPWTSETSVGRSSSIWFFINRWYICNVKTECSFISYKEGLLSSLLSSYCQGGSLGGVSGLLFLLVDLLWQSGHECHRSRICRQLCWGTSQWTVPYSVKFTVTSKYLGPLALPFPGTVFLCCPHCPGTQGSPPASASWVLSAVRVSITSTTFL